jgi:aldehyde dehydrogenase (NAD+)
MNTVLHYIELGRQECGEPLAGGHRLTGPGYEHGWFVEPTLFAGVDPNAAISREEIFGPVLAVTRARDFRHALELANATEYGLSASIQTTNIARVFEFIQGVEAGLITINLPSAGVEYQLPFGGTKDSSFGPKEQGPAAIEFYSDYKTVYLRY